MTELETQFWKIFGRTLGRAIEAGSYRAEDLREWDSLRHVELIFALEDAYGLDCSPDDIADLYSSTDEVLKFLEAQRENLL